MLRYIEGGRIGVTTGTVGGVRDVLDIIATAYSNGAHGIIIYKEALPDGFFLLNTGLAGEMLQKFPNYGIRLAIVGDFENVQSKSLAAFIRECNRGNHVFFKKSEKEAAGALTGHDTDN
ncbi:MAG: DUF4180 domain-containing protein [Eubacteriales bacterium]|nr:DUF4180 domain-containing protein [Eubacteriales bacterium]